MTENPDTAAVEAYRASLVEDRDHSMAHLLCARPGASAGLINDLASVLSRIAAIDYVIANLPHQRGE
jgi:hypothetical protein